VRLQLCEHARALTLAITQNAGNAFMSSSPENTSPSQRRMTCIGREEH
jgi:hypothetical protein